MKSHRKELWFNLPTRRGFVNITPEVETALRESGIKEGFVLVNAMHISASIFINDDEHGLHHDYENWLEKLAPHEPIDQYRHNDIGEDNADPWGWQAISVMWKRLSILSKRARPSTPTLVMKLKPRTFNLLSRPGM